VLEELLDEALRAARVVPEIAGMASVKIMWDPYEIGWVAEANWSDGQRLRTEPSGSAIDAILDLIDLLKET